MEVLCGAGGFSLFVEFYSPMWFTPPAGKEREFLAVAIAAASSKRKVLAIIEDVDNWKPLKELYFVDTPSE